MRITSKNASKSSRFNKFGSRSLDLNKSISNSIISSNYILLGDGKIKRKRNKNSYMESFYEKRRMAAEFAHSKNKFYCSSSSITPINIHKSSYNENKLQNLENIININNLKNNLPGKAKPLIDNSNNIQNNNSPNNFNDDLENKKDNETSKFGNYNFSLRETNNSKKIKNDTYIKKHPQREENYNGTTEKNSENNQNQGFIIINNENTNHTNNTNKQNNSLSFRYTNNKFINFNINNNSKNSNNNNSNNNLIENKQIEIYDDINNKDKNINNNIVNNFNNNLNNNIKKLFNNNVNNNINNFINNNANNIDNDNNNCNIFNNNNEINTSDIHTNTNEMSNEFIEEINVIKTNEDKENNKNNKNIKNINNNFFKSNEVDFENINNNFYNNMISDPIKEVKKDEIIENKNEEIFGTQNFFNNQVKNNKLNFNGFDLMNNDNNYKNTNKNIFYKMNSYNNSKDQNIEKLENLRKSKNQKTEIENINYFNEINDFINKVKQRRKSAKIAEMSKNSNNNDSKSKIINFLDQQPKTTKNKSSLFSINQMQNTNNDENINKTNQKKFMVNKSNRMQNFLDELLNEKIFTKEDNFQNNFFTDNPINSLNSLNSFSSHNSGNNDNIIHKSPRQKIINKNFRFKSIDETDYQNYPSTKIDLNIMNNLKSNNFKLSKQNKKFDYQFSLWNENNYKNVIKKNDILKSLDYQTENSSHKFLDRVKLDLQVNKANKLKNEIDLFQSRGKKINNKISVIFDVKNKSNISDKIGNINIMPANNLQNVFQTNIFDAFK